MRDLLAISLFTGAGGMDLGIKKAGFNIMAEVEIDKHCCATLAAAKERERSDTLIFETDIRALDPECLCGQLNIEPGDCDLLFGGPTCHLANARIYWGCRRTKQSGTFWKA